MAPVVEIREPCNGPFAASLIEGHTRRLITLQSPVLADGDPEPLHQMRVTMRRLRTVLHQFGPALLLPEGVGERRLAKVGRRLGLTRDLDVLRGHLEEHFLPGLPAAEVKALRPVFRQLRRERRLAREHLVEVLQSGSYLRLLARLQHWLREPRFTPLGEAPLADWLVEWQIPPLLDLFSHPGWFVAELADDPETVHDLRKRCKGARYALENLRPLTGPRLGSWARRFRRFQDLLGELNDLQVLERAIEHQLPGTIAEGLPRLNAQLAERAGQCWGLWRREAEPLRQRSRRRRLLAALLGEPAPGG